MAVNYTVDMVELMKVRYSANPTRETVEEYFSSRLSGPSGFGKESQKLTKTARRSISTKSTT